MNNRRHKHVWHNNCSNDFLETKHEQHTFPIRMISLSVTKTYRCLGPSGCYLLYSSPVRVPHGHGFPWFPWKQGWCHWHFSAQKPGGGGDLRVQTQASRLCFSLFCFHSHVLVVKRKVLVFIDSCTILFFSKSVPQGHISATSWLSPFAWEPLAKYGGPVGKSGALLSHQTEPDPKCGPRFCLRQMPFHLELLFLDRGQMTSEGLGLQILRTVS